VKAMKKVLIGCGIVVLLVIVAVGAVGFIMVRAGKKMVESGQKMAQAYKETDRLFAFTPPAGEIVTGEQLDRWLAVRQKVLPSVAAFKKRFESQPGKNPFVVIGAVMEQSGQFVDAHVAALKDRKMSALEYFWIARRVFTALQSGDALKDAELKDVVAAFGKMNEGARQRQQGGNSAAMYVPMTSEAIAKTLATIKQRKQALLATRDVTIADFMIAPMLESFSQMGEKGGRAGGKAGGNAAGVPVAVPAAAPAK
jgi:hypothetical protein